MSRYTGSTFKKSRRYGFSILETNKEFSKGKKRFAPPGDRSNRRHSKLSNYGVHLYEKQKVRFMYGLNERQFKNNFAKASKMKGNLGLNFLILLESRLDNLVFRLGGSLSRKGARQLVTHGHVLVDGKRVDIASYIVQPGQVISFDEKTKNNEFFKEAFEASLHSREFLEIDEKNFTAKYTRHPEREELSSGIDELLIVEYYNK